MSDMTNNTEGWTPVSNTGNSGFCQDCGRPLTPETARPVGTSLFCEPCLHLRVGAAGQPGAAYAAGTVPPPAVPRVVTANEPHPVLAGLLGLIPGVGAIYNGQFAKGFVHLIIFAVLVSFASHVSDIFGLFVFGWVCYQVFDAYHTAVARRDGLTLPNPFGLNDIGERMGFGKSWGVVPPPTAAPGSAAPYGAPVSSGPDWVGYVHPDAIPVTPPAVDPAAAYVQPPAPTFGQAPYASTYTGVPYGAVPPIVVPPARRFPVGAFWLIGLGVLILLGNFLPDIRITGHWFLPVFFAGLSVFLFTRRMHTYGTSSIVCYLRWPVTLMVLAILFALQAGYVATLGQTWPVLLVTIGALLLLERTVGVAPVTPYDPLAHSVAPTGSVVPAIDDLSAHVRKEDV